MKKTILSVLLPIAISIVIFLVAISIGIEHNNEIEEEKVQIVTTIFPVYDFARQIAGDKAEVTMLLPLGTESHDYEPSPQDIIKIQEADLFIYTGKYMEVWAENILQTLPSTENVVDASKGIKLKSVEEIEEEHGEHEEEQEEHKHNHEYEVHIWTSPEYAIKMCDNILEKLCLVDEENREYYEENAKHYKEELEELDKEFKKTVDNAKRKKIISGSRFPFYYLTNRYGIEYEAAYDSCNSETRSKCKKSNRINSNNRKRKYTSYLL